MGAMVEEEEREEGRRNVEGEKGRDGTGGERERERRKTGYIIVSMSQEVPNIKFSLPGIITLMQWQFCASHQPWAR